MALTELAVDVKLQLQLVVPDELAGLLRSLGWSDPERTAELKQRTLAMRRIVAEEVAERLERSVTPAAVAGDMGVVTFHPDETTAQEASAIVEATVKRAAAVALLCREA